MYAPDSLHMRPVYVHDSKLREERRVERPRRVARHHNCRQRHIVLRRAKTETRRTCQQHIRARTCDYICAAYGQMHVYASSRECTVGAQCGSVGVLRPGASEPAAELLLPIIARKQMSRLLRFAMSVLYTRNDRKRNCRSCATTPQAAVPSVAVGYAIRARGRPRARDAGHTIHARTRTTRPRHVCASIHARFSTWVLVVRGTRTY
eukprot:COSAG02_NODE_8987_length_2372_cov_1.285526_1_plen_206_part_00